MERKEILEKVTEILNIEIGIEEEVKEESHLQTELGMDSLDLVEFIMYSETKFNIMIDDEEAEKVETIKQAIDVIESKL